MNIFQTWINRMALDMIKAAMPLWCKCKANPLDAIEDMAMDAIRLAKNIGGITFVPIHREYMWREWGCDEDCNIYDPVKFNWKCYGDLSEMKNFDDKSEIYVVCEQDFNWDFDDRMSLIDAHDIARERSNIDNEMQIVFDLSQQRPIAIYQLGEEILNG